MSKKLNVLSHVISDTTILDNYSNLLDNILLTIENKQQEAAKKLHQTLVEMYWEIGRYIVVYVQENKKAEYGEEVIKSLAKDIENKNVKRYSFVNLKNIRQFYLVYPESSLLRQDIKWSHYLHLIRPRKDIILEYFKKKSKLSVKNYQKIANVSRATAHRDLTLAVEEEWLQKTGKTRSVFYSLVDKVIH